jgi:hypothetical protein
MGNLKFNVKIDTYKERLEERIIAWLAEKAALSLDEAMDVYYSSRLARQIEEGDLGLENMDPKYLAEDLMENESELLNRRVVC